MFDEKISQIHMVSYANEGNTQAHGSVYKYMHINTYSNIHVHMISQHT
jgi:hypothetical protein